MIDIKNTTSDYLGRSTFNAMLFAGKDYYQNLSEYLQGLGPGPLVAAPSPLAADSLEVSNFSKQNVADDQSVITMRDSFKDYPFVADSSYKTSWGSHATTQSQGKYQKKKTTASN